jgi:hypothetical protein
MENNDYSTVDEAASQKTDNRPLIGLVAIFLLFMCMCVVIVSVVLADPFDWNLLSLLGGGDAAVKSMPIDTEIYIGLDMSQLTVAEIGRLVDPFIEDDQTFDYRNFADALRDIDEELEDAAGFNLVQDILPWIGPSVGIGLIDYQLDQFSGLENVSFLVAAETRDEAATDDFIVKFIDGVEDASGSSFDESNYKDVFIYELDAIRNEDRFAIARSNDILFLGSSDQAVREGIDAQKGKSLADHEEYGQLERKMPANRAITLYLGSNIIAESTEGLLSGLPLALDDVPLVGEEGGALTLTIIDAGLQLDVLSLINSDQLSDEERLLLEGSRGATADMYPEKTVLYLATGSVNQFWEALAETTPDLEEAMDELEDELGFDLVNDLIVYLDGETGVGLWPSSAGVLADSADIALGFAALAGTSDEVQVIAASDDINRFAEQQLMTVDSSSSDELTVYTVSEDFLGLELNYGVGSGYFFIASGDEAVEEVFGEGPKLADSERYRSVWSEFPRGSSPLLYLDLEGFANALTRDLDDLSREEIDEIAALASPISIIAIGSGYSGDVGRATIILFIEAEEG